MPCNKRKKIFAFVFLWFTNNWVIFSVKFLWYLHVLSYLNSERLIWSKEKSERNRSTYMLCTLLSEISINADLISGPCESVHRQPLRCQLNFVTSRNDENGGEYYGSVACVTLLYRRFNLDDMSISGSMEMLHSLQFLPVFVECKWLFLELNLYSL